MPVTIFRRHQKDCPHRAKGRKWEKCNCRITIDKRYAVPGGKLESLATTDWRTAERIARDIDLGISPVESEAALAGPMTIEKAVEDFLAKLQFEDLADGTYRMHQTLLAQLRAFGFSAKPQLSLLSDFDHAAIMRFTHSWAKGGLQPHPDEKKRFVTKPMGALARTKKLERLRQFFKFGVLRKWIADDPTAGLKGAKITVQQKEGFTPQEIDLILEKADELIREKTEPRALAAAIRLRALVLFMLFSGLRISDAVGCPIANVKNGQVQLIPEKQKKKGKKVIVDLPARVIEALGEVPPISPLYWFWTGKGLLRTAKNTAWRQLNALFKAAGIQDAHPHRFRDTFALAMREAGQPVEKIAAALGDTVPVVLRHYYPTSDEVRKQTSEAIQSTWQNNPVLDALDARARKKAKAAVVTIPRRASGTGR